MGSFSLGHWLVVIVVALLVFGPKRFSDLGKGLGQGLRNFKSGLSEDEPDSPTPSEGNRSLPPH